MLRLIMVLSPTGLIVILLQVCAIDNPHSAVRVRTARYEMHNLLGSVPPRAVHHQVRFADASYVVHRENFY